VESLSAISDPFELIKNTQDISGKLNTVKYSGTLNNGQIDFSSILNRAKAAQSSDKDKAGNQSPKIAANGKIEIDKTDKLYEMCLELETYLVKNLLTSMRNTVQKSGLINEGFAGQIYEDMLYDEYAKSYAKNAGFGLAEQAYRQLKAYQ